MSIHLHNKLNFLKVDGPFGGDFLGAAQESDQHHRGPKIGERSEHIHPSVSRTCVSSSHPTSAGEERGM